MYRTGYGIKTINTPTYLYWTNYFFEIINKRKRKMLTTASESSVKQEQQQRKADHVMFHEPDMNALPSKSALKKNPILFHPNCPTQQQPTSPAPPETSPEPSSLTIVEDHDSFHDSYKKKHLTWDEAGIEEHDLTRGTRMKVRTYVCAY